jgi:branched-chain amino acid transport system ATP-binding protein
MIRIDDISVSFGGVQALKNISAEMADPVCGIIGPNGAGKTTLLNVFSGFVAPRSGRIDVDGTDILGLPPHMRARWGLRRGFQREQVVEDLTVAENVRVIIDAQPLPSRQMGGAVARALAFCGLAAKADLPGARLNAYERRMVEIARCVVGKPRIILLDEPGGGLGQAETASLREKISAIWSEFGAQVLLIDHDVDLIQAVCQSAIVLDFGVLIAAGPTASVLQDPKVRSAYLGIEDAA